MLAGFSDLIKAIDAKSITAKDIAEKSSEEVYRIITGLQVRTFSTDKPYSAIWMKKDQRAEFDLWVDLLEAATDYLKNPEGLATKYKHDLITYQGYLSKLSNDTIWLDLAIRGEISFKQSEIETKLADINIIMKTAFNNIDKEKPKSTKDSSFGKWVKLIQNKYNDGKNITIINIDKVIAKIFPKPLTLEKFLTEYLAAMSRDKKIAKDYLGYEDPHIYYENRQNVINTYEQVKSKNDKYQIDRILERLRQVIYLEDQKFFKGDLSKQKAVLRDIKNQYPNILDSYINAKFSDSQDKLSKIIIGIADSLYGALEHFQKDIAAKKPQQAG